MISIEKKQKRSLLVIKFIHSFIWLFYNGVIFYILYAAITNTIDKWIWICIGLVLLEGIVLLLFKWFCPLTILARKYSNSTKSNFDIYLPEWLARHNKIIYTIIFISALLILAYQIFINNK
ncbi:MAG: hypothetical protein JST10_00640 [Bacteroidetes bacterium]|nr:hypothetical protein [Bacteroidota bacterium]